MSNVQLRDQCNLLLADFDKQCENLKAEAVREAKAAADSIATLYRFNFVAFKTCICHNLDFRLEMMKIPMETKAMKWEDYYEQNSRSALGLSKAVAEAVDDSVVEAVDTQVIKQHSTLNNLISVVQIAFCLLITGTMNNTLCRWR